MSYFTLLTIALIRYEAQDYNAAIERFTDALNQPLRSTDVFNNYIIFFHHGLAYYLKKEFDLLGRFPDAKIANENARKYATDMKHIESIEERAQKIETKLNEMIQK